MGVPKICAEKSAAFLFLESGEKAECREKALLDTFVASEHTSRACFAGIDFS